MRKHLKSVLALSIALTMILSLAACGSSSSTSATSSTEAASSAQSQATSSQAAPKEVKELTILTHATWVKAGMQAAVDLVNSKPELGVKLSFEKVPEGDPGEQVIQARYASGDVPDILWWQPASYANARMKVSDNFIDIKGDWMQNYDQAALNTPTYILDGKLVVAPIGDINMFGMLYNKKVFSDAGVTVPKNWSELLSACDKFKAKGITSVFYAGKDAWTLQILPLASGPREAKTVDMNTLVANMDTNKTKWVDLKQFKDAVAKTKELLDKGYVQKTYLSDTYAQAENAIINGTCAMFPMSTWVAPDLMKIAPDKFNDVGFFPIPFDGDDKAPAATPGGLYVSSGGKNIDLAKNIVFYLAGKEAAAVYFKAQPGIPFIKGIQVELTGEQKDGLDLTNNSRTAPSFIDYTKYQKGPFEKYMQDLLVGGKTPDKVCAELDKDFAKQAKVKKDPNWK